MAIKDIFVKDINRTMNPVIKVSDIDDEDTIFQELDEYVVTNEIDKNFDKLYKGITDGLKGNKDHMGVWISGDFGSGKSHFLKIVSFLLRNREVRGRNAIEYLREKVSPGVYQMMQAIGRRDIDTILFDIDAKSKNGQDEDSLIQTFALVFNEMLGLSSDPSVAEFERYLMSIEKYEDFKESYQRVSKNNKSWEDDRARPAYIQNNIVKALLDCGVYSDEDEAKGVAKKTSMKSSMSAEDFAKMVGEHCRSRGGNGYTLFFLVDEVGQFISGNVQKMLKLQTIVQELGVNAAGQAWVVVTSQEDIEAIVQGVSNNDFSKIQGRFSTRIKMVSSDVKEVIEKRVLEKKTDDEQYLSALYEGSRVDIQTKLALDNRMTIRLYRDSREFADTYPFIPYQYDMLQVMLTQLRNKTAAGKNLSNAARSMLRIFKDAAANHGDCDIGTIVPLYGFFDPIRDELDAPTNLVFSRARDNPDLNDFDLKVLETLYLVKYYDGLDTNLGNIAALMMSSLEQNRLELKAEIEESLNRLIEQNFVQRSGDVYIYLTNQEQEVNREILRETVDQYTLYSKISDIAFGQIFNTSTKYSFDSNHSYPFNRMVDGENMGNSSHELSIHISTPRDHADPAYLPTISNNGVLFDLPDNKQVLDLFSEIIRTETYIRKKAGTTMSTQHQDVINTKKGELTQMKERAAGALATALQNATVYINGNQVDISDSLSPEKRLDESMGKLIRSVYNKMDYIKVNRKTKDIETVFKTSTLIPFDDMAKECGNAMGDLVDYLQMNMSNNTTVVIKNVIEKYSRKPYGFNDTDIEWMLSVLFRHGRIDLVYDGKEYRGNNIDPKLAMSILTNKSYHDRVRIVVRESVTSEQIHRAKTVYDGLFMKSIQSDESRIVEAVNNSAKSMMDDIDKLAKEYTSEPRYPGKEKLDSMGSVIKKLCDIPSPDLFKYTDSNEEFLRSIRPDYDNLSNFFSAGSRRKEIFDRALEALSSYDGDKAYLGSEAREIADKISNIVSSGDFKRIPYLNQLCAGYERISKEDTEYYRTENVGKFIEEMTSVKEGHSDDPDLYEKLGKEIDSSMELLSGATTISAIRGVIDGARFRIERIEKSHVKPAPPSVTEPPDSGGSSPTPVPGPTPTPVPVRKKVTATSIISSKKIESEEDVDAILEALRSKLMDKLKDGPFDIVW